MGKLPRTLLSLRASFGQVFAAEVMPPRPTVTDLGDRLEICVDRALIDTMEGATLAGSGGAELPRAAGSAPPLPAEIRGGTSAARTEPPLQLGRPRTATNGIQFSGLWDESRAPTIPL